MSDKTEQAVSTILSKATDTYMPLIERQLEDNQITFSEYARECVVYGVMAINNTLKSQNLTWQQIDGSNIQEILMQIARLQLNASVSPRECYFQIRNVNTNQKDEKGYDIWKKVIEMGIEGNGFDALLSRFGRNVKTVYPFWVVREGDDFEYPSYNGIEMNPPKWIPKGTGKVMRVVYPILDKNNIIHYYIGEREDVRKNLLAHINNNMMNETFGIVTGTNAKGKPRTRFDATFEEKKKIESKKRELKLKARDMNIEQILDSEEFDKFISPAWKEDFSREEMITRKIRNNIVRKIPMDFESPFVQESFDEVSNESYRKTIDIINEETATKEIDLQGVEFDDSTGEVIANGTNTPNEQNNAHNPNLEPNIEDRKKPDFD